MKVNLRSKRLKATRKKLRFLSQIKMIFKDFIINKNSKNTKQAKKNHLSFIVNRNRIMKIQVIYHNKLIKKAQTRKMKISKIWIK